MNYMDANKSQVRTPPCKDDPKERPDSENMGDEEMEGDLISSINYLQDVLEDGEMTDQESVLPPQSFSKSFSDSEETLGDPAAENPSEDHKSIDGNLMDGLRYELVDLMTSFKNSMKENINTEFQEKMSQLNLASPQQSPSSVEKESPTPSKELSDKKISQLKAKNARHLSDLKNYYEDRLSKLKHEMDSREREMDSKIGHLESQLIPEETLKAKYSAAMRTVAEMQEQLKTNNATFQRWRQQNAQSTRVINELTAKIDQMSDDALEREKAMKQLREDCSALREEVESSLQKAAIWRDKFSGECQKYEKVCLESSAKSEEVEDLRGRLAASESQVARLREEIVRLTERGESAGNLEFNSPLMMAEGILRRSKAEDRRNDTRVTKLTRDVEEDIYQEDVEMHSAITAALERIRDGKIFSKANAESGEKRGEAEDVVETVDGLKERMRTLIEEKNELLSSLSKVSSIFGTGRVSLTNRNRKERIESRLDEIDRELGSVRMNLKRYHVL